MTIEATPGAALDYDGQRYLCIEVEPYTRRDGIASGVAVWRSRCAACGDAFYFRTARRFGRFQPNRRCVAHKRPGSRPRYIVSARR